MREVSQNYRVLAESGADGSIGRHEICPGSGDFHRLTAGLALDDNPAQAQLIVESTGNAATMKNMKARGYLRLNRINFSGSLRALVASWFPTLAARIGNIESELATELWFESNKSGHVAMRGRLGACEGKVRRVGALP